MFKMFSFVNCSVVFCCCLVSLTWSKSTSITALSSDPKQNAVGHARPSRQTVVEATEIQDTVVPDVPVGPRPQVVDTVEIQDTLVGPTGAQTPISSSSTSQVSGLGLTQSGVGALRPSRQVVIETTEIQDTIVPDVPVAPQVVDTVEVQDTVVGRNGAQIPISSSSTSQISSPGIPQPFGAGGIRSSRQLVAETTEIQDIIVPDVPVAPQVVDTVQAQDSIVGPTGAEIPISSSTTQQISGQGMPRSGFYKRDFPKKFHFFPDSQRSVTMNNDLEAQPAKRNKSSATVNALNSTAFPTTISESFTVTIASSSAQPEVFIYSFQSHRTVSLRQNRTTPAPVQPTTSFTVTTARPSSTTTAKPVAVATSKTTPSTENSSFPAVVTSATTSRPIKQHVIFTLPPTNKIPLDKISIPVLQDDEDAFAVPMSRENPDIYAIAQRAASYTSARSAGSPADIPPQPVPVAMSGRAQRDEEPPATPLQLELAEKKARASPEHGLTAFTALAGTANRTVFAEFRPRDFFD